MRKSLRHGYLNCLTGRVVLACLLSALTSCALAAAPWQVKDFEIFIGNPHAWGRQVEFIADTGLDSVGEYFDEELHTELAKLENFLHSVAVEFEKMGFADPVASGHLKPVYRHPTGKKIRVYLTDVTSWNPSISLAGAGLAYYVGKCSKLEQYNTI